MKEGIHFPYEGFIASEYKSKRLTQTGLSHRTKHLISNLKYGNYLYHAQNLFKGNINKNMYNLVLQLTQRIKK